MNKFFALFALLAGGLFAVACEDDSAGEEVGDAIEEAGEDIQDAADEAGDEMEEAADDMDDPGK